MLVAGGLTGEFEESAVSIWENSMASAEVYDPATELWSRVGYLPDETADLIATRNNEPAILLSPNPPREGVWLAS